MVTENDVIIAFTKYECKNHKKYDLGSIISFLEPEEIIIGIIEIGFIQGLLLCTNQRLAYLTKSNETPYKIINSNSFPYKIIMTMDMGKYMAGLIFKQETQIINIASYKGKNSFEPYSYSHDNADKFFGDLKKAFAESKTRATTQSLSKDASNMISGLENLAKLHENGSLTDDEFIQAKKKLLN